jgi:hypothetical protein
MAQEMAGKAAAFAQSPQGQQMMGQAQGLAGQAQGLMKGLAGGIPRAKGPTLESFLESLGVPQIPIKGKKVPGDFLGNAARWWVKTASSPYLGTLVKLTFFFMFFISFLESTPLVGRVVAVALDVVLAGGRILVKALQKGLPALIGLIPLPYTQLSATVLVSVIGMFVWTILATISFGRQDFTSAIESMLRIIPMPIGDAMADAFLDVNRTIDQFNEKRIKLTDDVWNGILLLQQFLAGISTFISGAASSAFQRIQSGADKLLNAIQGIRGSPEPTPPPFVPGASPFQQPIPTAMPVPGPVPGPVPMAMTVPMAMPMPEAPPPLPPTAPPMPMPEAPPPLPPTAPPMPMPEAPPALPPAPTPMPEAPPALPPAPTPMPEAPPALPPAPTPMPEAPAPVPEAPPAQPAPTFEAGPPPATPVPEPLPVQPAPPAPAFEAGPPPAQSALERLRSGQSVNRNLNVGRGFRGGKTLSGKRHKGRKWTRREHPLYERFYGLGSR